MTPIRCYTVIFFYVLFTLFSIFLLNDPNEIISNLIPINLEMIWIFSNAIYEIVELLLDILHLYLFQKPFEAHPPIVDSIKKRYLHTVTKQP